MGYNWARTNMKKSLYLLAFICCVLSVACTKVDDGTNVNNGADVKEDLSYLIKTYECCTAEDNHIYKSTWTYDGYKETSWKIYVDGQMTSECKNYSYDGLNASWDVYSYYNNGTSDPVHVECEYLDESFRRVKYRKEASFHTDSSNNTIYETYYEYNGKKRASNKHYRNGVLTYEAHDFNYDGLHCSYILTSYSSPNVVDEECIYDILYLDDTYLRAKSIRSTTERFHQDGTSTTTTQLTVRDYDGKKPIGSQIFVNGQLSSVTRDYQYDGLTCFYYSDTYRDGEVISTQMYEVEYLE